MKLECSSPVSGTARISTTLSSAARAVPWPDNCKNETNIALKKKTRLSTYVIQASQQASGQGRPQPQKRRPGSSSPSSPHPTPISHTLVLYCEESDTPAGDAGTADVRDPHHPPPSSPAWLFCAAFGRIHGLFDAKKVTRRISGEGRDFCASKTRPPAMRASTGRRLHCRPGVSWNGRKQGLLPPLVEVIWHHFCARHAPAGNAGQH